MLQEQEQFSTAEPCVLILFLLRTSNTDLTIYIEWRVYKTSPCGYYASSCSVGTGVSPLSIWWQVPNVALGAISECFCNVTAYEIAYARSPKDMKSVVFALFLFNNALSSALGEILTSVTVDPHLIWVWAGLAIALAAQTIVFYWKYRELDNDEFMTYQDDREAVEEYRRGSLADPKAASVENKSKLETLEEVKTDSVKSTAGGF